MFDKDKSGQISIRELGRVFQSMGMKMSKQEILEMVREVDEDGSGDIDFGEFLELMAKQSK